MSSTPSRIRILLVSDLHCRQDYLDQIQHSIPVQSVDVILCAGDMINVQHPTETPAEDDRALATVLDALTSMSVSAQARWFYIAGNHDPAHLFLVPGKCETDGTAHNVHGRSVVLGECEGRKLKLVSWGGSAPSYFKHRPDEKAWDGFPFGSDAELGEALVRCIGPDLSDSSLGCRGDDVILMTHMGPSECATTDINKHPLEPTESRIESGSEAIRQLVLKYQPVVNLHGHSHFSWGVTRLGETEVVNPGPLRDGRYALLEFVYLQGKWVLSDVEFRRVLSS